MKEIRVRPILLVRPILFVFIHDVCWNLTSYDLCEDGAHGCFSPGPPGTHIG